MSVRRPSVARARRLLAPLALARGAFPFALGAFPLALGAFALALAPLSGAVARADVQQTGGSQTPASAPASPQPALVATLEQCQTSALEAERSATFSGEMASIAGSARMQMRIDVEERMPEEARFHIVHAPGLGVWRSAAVGVKSYKYLKQVTNLSAPAYYRAAVRFRWLNAGGHPIRDQERHTAACLQTAPPPGEEGGEAPAGGVAPTTAASSPGAGSAPAPANG